MSSYKIALVIYLVILAFLNLNPWILPDSSLAIGNIAWDKIDHVIAYCLLSLLLMSAYSFHKWRLATAFIAFLVSSGIGLLLEYCQLWFTSTREFSFYDIVANTFGAALGVILYQCYILYGNNTPKA